VPYTDESERPKAWKRKPRQPDVREPEQAFFDFPLRQTAEARRDAEFVAPVMATPTHELRGMVRGTDAIESQRAATDQLSGRAKLQARLLDIIATEGPQTDKELEARPEFADYGPSTVRKRRNELMQAGKLERAGRRDGCAIWQIP
jgi:hypothetical protein